MQFLGIHCVSFDFDWCLRVNGGEPNMQMVKLFQFFNRKNVDVILCTSRHYYMMRPVHEFLNLHGLKTIDVINTDGARKGPFLAGRSQIHFDDCDDELESCRKYGVRGVNCWNSFLEGKWLEFIHNQQE